MLRAAWGFTVETATQGIRFVLSGVFDAYPGLKIILGHMGEGLPFLSVAHQPWAARDDQGEDVPRYLLRAFLDHDERLLLGSALVCCMMEMGIDRILFSVDYPFAENPPGTEWLKTLPLGPEDTEKLLNGNARRLLKL